MQAIRRLCVICLIISPEILSAQATQPPTDGGPLSVIDWLGERPKPTPKRSRPPPKPAEAPVAKSALPSPVSVNKLGQGRPRAIGLVPAKVTGLPQDIWSRSSASQIAQQLDRLPELHLPAAHTLLFTLLLAEATAPEDDAKQGDALALARVSKLMDAGALDPALSLIEQAGVATSQDHFKLWMDISLLLGTEDRACELLQDKPFLSSDYGVRILCSVRSGKWENAALTLGAIQALQLLPPDDLALLDRFLNPDLYDGAVPLPTPRSISPLSFRLFEAIGEAKSTRNLPPKFAVSDLRDIAGWKAQLDAAERLTRIGALPDNRFLGIYTSRDPAASGGVWDRVEALQRFDTALYSGSADAVAKTLSGAWHAMTEAEVEISFAALYAERLRSVPLKGPSTVLRDHIMLLSPLYETLQTAHTESTEMQFLKSIARGEPPQAIPDIRQAAAIASAFSDPSPRSDWIGEARNGQLGSAILHTIGLLEEGARGDTFALRDALSTLRALGLEDTARRASLQVLLLERE
tara:strand:+ start:2215 stop:3780 length:1566 start_codon:yes stop_codon:yes gene_type:complete